MPVRFRCDHCQQRLSVGSNKAGSVVLCPKCKHQIVVPLAETPQAPAEPAPPAEVAVAPDPASQDEAPTPAAPFPEFNVYEYETEYVYVEDEDDRGPREPVDLDKVAVPRWVLYAQGVLLGLVALAGFGFGIVVGGASPREGESPDAGGPWSVTGMVAYDAGDNLPTPDAGATVLLLPEDARPEVKAAVAPFLPGGRPLDPSDPALAAIQQIGGDAAHADAEGKFRLRVPQSGAYFVLILSAHRDRAGERPAPQHLAEIGRYFESAPELLGESRYDWTKTRVRDHETISHVFR